MNFAISFRFHIYDHRAPVSAYCIYQLCITQYKIKANMFKAHANANIGYNNGR